MELVVNPSVWLRRAHPQPFRRAASAVVTGRGRFVCGAPGCDFGRTWLFSEPLVRADASSGIGPADSKRQPTEKCYKVLDEFDRCVVTRLYGQDGDKHRPALAGR